MEYLQKYGYVPSAEQIASNLQSIATNLPELPPAGILKTCFSLMDLTTLRANDTPESVKALVEKANAVPEALPGYPMPASICVYPNFAGLVASARASAQLHVTTVSGCFPSSQSFPEVKVLECRRAVQSGADEVDIVLALSHFLGGDERSAFEEIALIRKAVDEEADRLGRKVILKVILETGLLVRLDLMAEASFLAMEAGADFIKTSTGKVDVNATPTAAYVMCEAIKKYYEASGRKVGFKAAGGISTAKDALSYYYIVHSVLGEEWIGKDFFRFGVSRLGNSLVSAIEQKTVNYF